jgi:hypothetical protein
MPPRLLPDVRLGSEEQPCSPSTATTPQVKTTEWFMIAPAKANRQHVRPRRGYRRANATGRSGYRIVALPVYPHSLIELKYLVHLGDHLGFGRPARGCSDDSIENPFPLGCWSDTGAVHNCEHEHSRRSVPRGSSLITSPRVCGLAGAALCSACRIALVAVNVGIRHLCCGGSGQAFRWRPPASVLHASEKPGLPDHGEFALMPVARGTCMNLFLPHLAFGPFSLSRERACGTGTLSAGETLPPHRCRGPSVGGFAGYMRNPPLVAALAR